MTLEEYKKNKSGHTNGFKTFKSILVKIIISVFLIVSILGICNLSDTTKELIKKELFQTDFNFSKINKIYNKLFNNQKESKEVISLNNGIDYSNFEPYEDGVLLNTKEGDTASFMDSGIVVFIGQKEGYGNTVIVQQSNGVDVWYGNVDNVNVSIYDYVNKNASFGSLKDKLYLVFQKNGEFLDYKEYIK